jgi:hypothetical protein
MIPRYYLTYLLSSTEPKTKEKLVRSVFAKMLISKLVKFESLNTCETSVNIKQCLVFLYFLAVMTYHIYLSHIKKGSYDDIVWTTT